MKKLNPAEIKQRLTDMLGGGLLNEKKGNKKVELKIRMAPESMKRIATMQERLSTDDPALVFRYALALLEGVLKQFDDGRVLIARDRGGDRRDVSLVLDQPEEEES